MPRWGVRADCHWSEGSRNADDIGAALRLLVQAFNGVGRVQPGAVLAREGHVGQHVMPAPRHGHSNQWRFHGSIHEIGQLGPAGTQLLGHLAPGFPCMGAVGLVERLTDRGGNDGVLAARDMGQCIAHPVNAVPLPGGFEDPGDGCLEAGMGVTDRLSAAWCCCRGADFIAPASWVAGPEEARRFATVKRRVALKVWRSRLVISRAFRLSTLRSSASASARGNAANVLIRFSGTRQLSGAPR